jgi:hypothetical protein
MFCTALGVSGVSQPFQVVWKLLLSLLKIDVQQRQLSTTKSSTTFQTSTSIQSLYSSTAIRTLAADSIQPIIPLPFEHRRQTQYKCSTTIRRCNSVSGAGVSHITQVGRRPPRLEGRQEKERQVPDELPTATYTSLLGPQSHSALAVCAKLRSSHTAQLGT